MKKLIRVARKDLEPIPFFQEGLRRDALAIPGRKFEIDTVYQDGCDFFLVEEMDVEGFVLSMAQRYPGCDVEVYGVERVGHCPAGEFAMKRVTEDGILPA